MIFLTPKWKKEAKLTIKGANKFVNYKKDLLDEDQIKNIRARQQEVKDSLKSKDAKEIKKKCNLLEQECKRSLTSYVRPNWIAENTEVFFVAIVIALGLRAYALQPFRIPTGSMRPSLNGVNGHYEDEKQWPSFAKRQFEKISYGRSYFAFKAEQDDEIVGFKSIKTMIPFYSLSTIEFKSGKSVKFNGSANALLEILTNKEAANLFKNRQIGSIPVKAGEVYASGFIDSGDWVLVDKVSYHFRKPKRGETTVFDTRNIAKIQARATKEQPAGSHYIKRLIGLPGDAISIGKDGSLYINGKIADDEGIQYAMKLSGFDRKEGHTGYTLLGGQDEELGYSQVKTQYAINAFNQELVLKKNKKSPQYSEYAAFGDNTVNSSDSRDWGAFKQYNLVGPAFLSIWPFRHEDKQHWGIIK